MIQKSEDLKQLFEDKPDSVLKARIKEFYVKLTEVNRLKKELDEAQDHKTEAEDILFQTLEDKGLELVRTEDGTFYQRFDFFASFDPTQKDKGYDWVRDLGFGDLIYETINARTFSAFIKDLRKKDENLELPEFVQMHTKKRVGYRKK